MKIKDVFYLVILTFSSVLLVLDLFISTGQPATFDATTHITNIAQFYKGLHDGDFPVRWSDGFANYGMPIALIAQQTTSYLGAIFNFFFNNVVLSYNIVLLVGSILSTLFYYIFLRIYLSEEAAFSGAFLFNFSAYRIINIYIRGAIPEFFASVFIPLILIGFFLFIKKKNIYGFFLIILASAFLVLTHPFLFLVSLFLICPYYVFLILSEKKKLYLSILSALAFCIGIFLTSYYLLPLFFEIKYFNYGGGNHLVPNQFLTLASFLDPNWYYFYKNDVFVRGNFIKVDIFETALFLGGIAFVIGDVVRNRKINKLLVFAVFSGGLLLLMCTEYSNILYQKINLLGGIQFPWRMLTAFMLIPPLILAIGIDKLKKYKLFFVLSVVIVVSLLRFPQLYGKNYTRYPESSYFFTTKNLHGQILNTIWTGKTEEYPVHKMKVAILEGKGTLTNVQVKNSSRQFLISSTTPIRMIDYTFYFPGWHVYVGHKEVPIQFQDPNFRGVITYILPAGVNSVQVIFKDTKIRTLGNGLTVVSILLIGLLFFFEYYSKSLSKRLK